MKIDRHLNLVMEIPRDEAPSVLVHSQALPNEVFEQYFDLCGPTYNALLTGGYGYVMPRYAALVFRRVAMARVGPEPAVPSDDWKRAHKAAEERANAFFHHLHALTYVLALKNSRYEMILVDDALRMGAIDAEEVSRIDGALCFFTCASQSLPREQREDGLGGLSLFNARIESLSCTEFIRSLPTSTATGNSGASQDSSPPSSPGQLGMDSNPSSAATAPGRVRRPSGIVLSSGSQKA